MNDQSRPVPINPIKVETEEEQKTYEAGERSSRIWKESSQKSLLKASPNDEESELIHAMWQRQLQYHSNYHQKNSGGRADWFWQIRMIHIVSR